MSHRLRAGAAACLLTALPLLACACSRTTAGAEPADAPVAEPLEPAALFVSPAGNDAWSGRLPAANAERSDGPLATLAGARDAVRALRRRDGGIRRHVTVRIAGGVYRLDGPVVLGPEDGGSERHPLVYAAAEGERPIFSGGRPITGWRRGTDGTWVADVPPGPDGERWVFEELFVDGRRAARARTPNDGYFRIDAAGADDRTNFTYAGDDLAAHADLAGGELVFLHDWSISRIPVAGVDHATRTVRLAERVGPRAAHYAMTHFEPHPRYFVENARSLLDAPGEWYLDAEAGRVCYRPRDGEDPATAEIVAPWANKLLILSAAPQRGQRLGHVIFDGLAFEHCAYRVPARGYAGGQAGFHEDRPAGSREVGGGLRVRAPAAVEFVGTEQCSFRNGRIAHVGGTAFAISGAARGCRIVYSEIADAGANGVMVGETSADADRVARGNIVARNDIHGCGARFFGAVGVWAGITRGTAIIGNEIHHLPYTGVSIGWQWNDDPTAARDNRVEGNHIHHVMQTLSDGGGIYTLGRQPGTALRRNRIHAVPVNAGRAQSNGMFLDEGTAGLVIEGNVVYEVARSPLRFHRAGENLVRGNVLQPPPGQPPVTYNATPEANVRMTGNTILPPDAPVP